MWSRKKTIDLNYKWHFRMSNNMSRGQISGWFSKFDTTMQAEYPENARIPKFAVRVCNYSMCVWTHRHFCVCEFTTAIKWVFFFFWNSNNRCVGGTKFVAGESTSFTVLLFGINVFGHYVRKHNSFRMHDNTKT